MIFLLIVVLLVVAIVLSRLTWASRLGERRSIKHHEQAMDVLRSVAGRPPGSEEAAPGAGTDAHVTSSVDLASHFPEPAGGSAVGRREETIRILRAEPSAAEPSVVEPPIVEPAHVEAAHVEAAHVEEAAGVETVGRDGTETRSDDVAWEPAAASSSNGQPIGYDSAAEAGPLPDPPALDDQYQPASSRAEARSRSRARTRAMMWARVLAPFVAAAQAVSEVVSEARGRLAARRTGQGAHEGGGEPTGEAGSTADAGGVPRVRTAAAVASVLRARQAAPPREASGIRVLWARLAELPRGARGLRVPRTGLAAGLATIVVVVAVTLGVLIATMSGSSHKVQQHAQASPPPAAPAPAPAPPPAPIKLVSSDQTGSVYNVTSNHLALSAVASGRVWLEVVAGNGPSGQVIFEGILTEGQSQQITNDAPVWVRIGAPGNVAVTVNGAGVLLPSATTPYNLTFST